MPPFIPKACANVLLFSFMTLNLVCMHTSIHSQHWASAFQSFLSSPAHRSPSAIAATSLSDSITTHSASTFSHVQIPTGETDTTVNLVPLLYSLLFFLLMFLFIMHAHTHTPLLFLFLVLRYCIIHPHIPKVVTGRTQPRGFNCQCHGMQACTLLGLAFMLHLWVPERSQSCSMCGCAAHEF